MIGGMIKPLHSAKRLMIAAQKKASLLSSFMSTRWSTLEMDKAITLIRANIMGFLSANVYFFIGVIVMAIIDFLLPYHYLEEKICRKQNIIDRKLLSTGFVVTLGLIIHNFPEGMAVFLSSFTNVRLGILLAIAIAIHNIPEGIAVAAPIYHATLNKSKAIKYAFISGMAEPLGAIISYLILKP